MRIVNGASEDGLTLVELVVVLCVMAILLAIAVPSVLSQRDRAADAAAQGNLRVAAASIHAYYTDHGTYVGMTSAVLEAEYDASFDPGVAIVDATRDDYCVETAVEGRTWRQAGPGEPAERGPC